MKRFISLALALILMMLAIPLTSCGDSIPYKETKEVTNLVIIDVEDFGKIVVELYPETAPITVDNFKKLVSEGFYDGLIFHRVISGFMIQGGGYTTEKRQKETASIKGEFASNGIQNDLKHERGVISMARTQVPDSATSQFFIMHKATESLDGNYAAFGKTVYGIEVVDAIASVKTNPNTDWPTETVKINSIRFAVEE